MLKIKSITYVYNEGNDNIFNFYFCLQKIIRIITTHISTIQVFFQSTFMFLTIRYSQYSSYNLTMILICNVLYPEYISVLVHYSIVRPMKYVYYKCMKYIRYITPLMYSVYTTHAMHTLHISKNSLIVMMNIFSVHYFFTFLPLYCSLFSCFDSRRVYSNNLESPSGYSIVPSHTLCPLVTCTNCAQGCFQLSSTILWNVR